MIQPIIEYGSEVWALFTKKIRVKRKDKMIDTMPLQELLKIQNDYFIHISRMSPSKLCRQSLLIDLGIDDIQNRIRFNNQKYQMKIKMGKAPEVITHLYQQRDKPIDFKFNPPAKIIISNNKFKYGYKNITKTKSGNYNSTLKYKDMYGNIKHKSFTTTSPKGVYIIKERYKAKNLQPWYDANKAKIQIFHNDGSLNELDDIIGREPNGSWNFIKGDIKKLMRKSQIDVWKNQIHGRILKKYKQNWGSDKTYLITRTKNIKIIRQMRIGCSTLTDHKQHLYKNPMNCPCCLKSVNETNEHYLEVCSKFKLQRQMLYNNLISKLKNVIPQLKKINTPLLLGFGYLNNPMSPKKLQSINKIIFYEVSLYIDKTCRFKNQNWILSKKKGIG